MVELKTADDLSKASERARRGKLFVQVIGWRQYRVTNREKGTQYTVDFFVRDGKRFGHCTCKGGLRNLACKHLSAAAARHITLAAESVAAH
jgi:uncharacterized Zn finger protein